MASGVVPFLDLGRRHATLATEIESVILKTARRAQYVLGPEVDAFEHAFADFLGGGYVIGVSSGTDAITLSLMGLGVGPGDEVVTVANTCMPTVSGIRAAGAEVRLADCDRATRLLEVDGLKRAVTPKTKAVVAVHLYGHLCDGPKLAAVCDEMGIALLEDCAQAHGATLHGRAAGTWGRASAFSFYPTKNLGAYGDGGAVFTRDGDLAERVRSMRMYGYLRRDWSVREGRNARLDELQAAILNVELRHLASWITRRTAIAEVYGRRLREVSPVGLPYSRPGAAPAHHLFVVTVEARQRVRDRLRDLGVETSVHYPTPVHQHPVYESRGWGPLPDAEWLCERVLSLPCYPELRDDEVDRVVEAVARVYA